MEANTNYIILGPDDSLDDMPLFWNNDLGWVSYNTATRFDKRILTIPLPMGSKGIFELNNDTAHSFYESGVLSLS